MTRVQVWLQGHADLDRLDRDLLLSEALGADRSQLMAHPERPLTNAELHQLDRWARRRRGGEPLAYILGRKEFWSLELAVTPAVLIPRPETELLVEQALWVDAHSGFETAQRILDLGTGSGAIAIALARELQDRAQICASDVSQAALKVAAANATTHNAAITLIASDWFVNISGTFHTIVSNPPYVPRSDPHLEQLHAEPRQALASGSEGLDAIRYIVPAARAHLVPNGWLLIEHGHDQGDAVRALMDCAGYHAVQTLPDLSGLERVSRGQWLGSP